MTIYSTYQMQFKRHTHVEHVCIFVERVHIYLDKIYLDKILKNINFSLSNWVVLPEKLNDLNKSGKNELLTMLELYTS